MNTEIDKPEETLAEREYDQSRSEGSDDKNVILNNHDQLTLENLSPVEEREQNAEDFHRNNAEQVNANLMPIQENDCFEMKLEKANADVRDETQIRRINEDTEGSSTQIHSENVTDSAAQDNPFLDENRTSCDKFPIGGIHGRDEGEKKLKSDSKTHFENVVRRESLSILAQSYEDTEPVYLSGIVDHITRSNEYKFEFNAREDTENELVHDRQGNENLSVTDLMSNESITDVFDRVYDMNSRREDCSDVNVVENFHNALINQNDPENELTSSSSGSGFSEVDGALKLTNTKIKSSLKRPNDDRIYDKEKSYKKARKGITFDSVSVYYFPRTQGFTCIPSQGGSTLGMSWNHSHSRKFSLGEHAAEQRRAHKQYCLQQFNAVKNWNELSTMSSDDSDSDEILSDSEVEFENYNFLQPIPTRERRAMLRAAGIHKIDSGEKDECRTIRSSREFCGCTCEVYCDPDRCVCAQAGIKCQVDRMNFPCSCTRDGCANENGRIEFNPVRVRTHYIHTLMRLEMEKKKEDLDEQRNRALMSNAENSSEQVYSSSSNINSNLMNFSYHTNLQTWGNEYTNSIPGATNCFNFGGYSAVTDHFSIGSMIDSPYHQNISRLAAPSGSPPASVQYCGQLPGESDECTRMLHYNNMNSSILEMNQNFLIHDLTNSSKSTESEVTYDVDPLVQSRDKHFEPQLDNTSQGESLDTSAEVSEETEKEDSDSENFGDIIKKTMVESVIA